MRRLARVIRLDVSQGAISVIESTHLLAGAGGDLAGFARAGFTPVTAVNHLPQAMATVKKNFPEVITRVEDIVRLALADLTTTPVLVASPICTEVSPAGRRGKRSASTWAATRATAWCLVRFAELHSPDVICGENVLDFATSWPLFEAWVKVFEAMGYVLHMTAVNAAHLSGPGNPPVPQLRERLLFVFAKRGIAVDLEVRPDAVCHRHGPVQGIRAWKNPNGRTVAGFRIGRYLTSYIYQCPRCAQQVEPVTVPVEPGIDWSLPLRYVRQGRFDNTYVPYADGARSRIQAGLDDLDGEPFLVVYRRHATYTRLDAPTATVTAGGNHHMLVIPGSDATVDGCQIRMLTTEEKAFLQGFPADFEFVVDGPKPKGFKGSIGGLLTGNAVPVNGAHWVADRINYALAA